MKLKPGLYPPTPLIRIKLILIQTQCKWDPREGLSLHTNFPAVSQLFHPRSSQMVTGHIVQAEVTEAKVPGTKPYLKVSSGNLEVTRKF